MLHIRNTSTTFTTNENYKGIDVATVIEKNLKENSTRPKSLKLDIVYDLFVALADKQVEFIVNWDYSAISIAYGCSKKITLKSNVCVKSFASTAMSPLLLLGIFAQNDIVKIERSECDFIDMKEQFTRDKEHRTNELPLFG